MSTRDQPRARTRRASRARTAAIDISAPLAEQPHYLTLAEAAAFLRRSTRALNRWESLGLLHVVRPAGGNPLVARTEIERLLSEGSSLPHGARSP